MRNVNVLVCACGLFLSSCIPALADSSTSGSDATVLNGSATFYASDGSLSTAIDQASFTTNNSFSQAFSFVLPSMGPIGDTLDSAMLNLTSSGVTSPPTSNPSSFGAVDPGYYYTYSYVCGSYSCNCGWGGCDTCYDYCSGTAFQPYSFTVPSPIFGQNVSLTISQISSGGLTENLPAGGGVVDLLALGFGSEIQAGDSFTVTGTRSLSLDLTGYNSTGGNGYGYFNVSGGNDLTASGVLDVQIADAPEPAAVLLLATAAALVFWRHGRRRRLNAD